MALGKTEHEASQKLNAQLATVNGEYKLLSANHKRLQEKHSSLTVSLNAQLNSEKGEYDSLFKEHDKLKAEHSFLKMKLDKSKLEIQTPMDRLTSFEKTEEASRRSLEELRVTTQAAY